MVIVLDHLSVCLKGSHVLKCTEDTHHQPKHTYVNVSLTAHSFGVCIALVNVLASYNNHFYATDPCEFCGV